MQALETLPKDDAALILEIVGLQVFREQFGMQQCLLRGIGPRRKMLGADRPEGQTAANVARDMLADLCRACPYQSCKMKIWGMG